MNRTLLALALALAACGPEGSKDPVGDTDTDTVPIEDSTVRGCTEAIPEVVPSGRGFRGTTPRVDLDAALSEDRTRELTRLLDAAMQAWEVYFDQAIPGPLVVTLTADDDSFRAAVADAGDTAPTDIGGFYSVTADQSFLFEQPSDYYTQVLLLHEATHQAHERIRGTDAEMPFWYVEGLAEHLARHHWDGFCVTLGARPLASLEDYLAVALEERDDIRIEDDLAADDLPSRGSVMAMWRFLETQDPTAAPFTDWRADADAGIVDYDTLSDVVDLSGRDGPYRRWLAEAQLPYEIVFTHWRHVDASTIVGDGAFTTLLRRKEAAPGPYEVIHGPLSDEAQGGLLVGHDDRDHYDALYLTATGAVNGFVKDGADPVLVPLGQIEAPDGPSVWHWDPDRGEVTVHGETFDFTPTASPAQGLASYGAPVMFTNVPD